MQVAEDQRCLRLKREYLAVLDAKKKESEQVCFECNEQWIGNGPHQQTLKDGERVCRLCNLACKKKNPVPRAEWAFDVREVQRFKVRACSCVAVTEPEDELMPVVLMPVVLTWGVRVD